MVSPRSPRYVVERGAVATSIQCFLRPRVVQLLCYSVISTILFRVRLSYTEATAQGRGKYHGN